MHAVGVEALKSMMGIVAGAGAQQTKAIREVVLQEVTRVVMKAEAQPEVTVEALWDVVQKRREKEVGAQEGVGVEVEAVLAVIAVVQHNLVCSVESVLKYFIVIYLRNGVRPNICVPPKR